MVGASSRLHLRSRASGLVRLVAGIALIASVGCSLGCGRGAAEKKLGPLPPTKESGSPVVARVADLDITADAVAAIMHAQHIDAKAACALAVRDALFAKAALDRRLDAGTELR